MGQALGCVVVRESTVAIKESGGKFDCILRPGLHFVPWCMGQSIAGYVTLRLQVLGVRCETKTKDNVFVTVVTSLYYRILADKASDAFYNLTYSKERMHSYVYDVICASIRKLNLADALGQKNKIARAVKKELKKALSMYGCEIFHTFIVGIELDSHVKHSMNDAESKYFANHGIVSQCQNTMDVMKFSDHVHGPSLKDVMDVALVTLYFDTIKEIGAKLSSFLIPHGPGAVTEIAPEIRRGLFQAQVHHVLLFHFFLEWFLLSVNGSDSE